MSSAACIPKAGQCPFQHGIKQALIFSEHRTQSVYQDTQLIRMVSLNACVKYALHALSPPSKSVVDVGKRADLSQFFLYFYRLRKIQKE